VMRPHGLDTTAAAAAADDEDEDDDDDEVCMINTLHQFSDSGLVPDLLASDVDCGYHDNASLRHWSVLASCFYLLYFHCL